MVNLSLEKNYYLNEKVRSKIINLIYSNSINAIILSGPPGLGKLNFVNSLSRNILCQFEMNNKIDPKLFQSEDLCFNNIKKNKSFFLFNNGSHPDFFYLNKINESKVIPIENTRNFKKFFQNTFSISNAKIGVIDTIEDLSLNSINLLLKTIEELSKKSYVFILSNKPSNIIKTIKSRCATFYFEPLNNEKFINYINNNLNTSKNEDEKSFLKNICAGSPGFVNKVKDINLYKNYNRFLDEIINYNKVNIRDIVSNFLSVDLKDKEITIYVFHLILNDLMKKVFIFLNQNTLSNVILEKEKLLLNVIIKNNNTLNILKLQSKFDRYMHLSESLNLNKVDVIIYVLKELLGVQLSKVLNE